MKEKISWGDQGDGTYRNPILNADYPDVDVEQFGDTYYMISSKQHMVPGMVILESKDMVNWSIITHVWDNLSWHPKYNWNQMDGYSFGVWAGDLAYHDGLWYCYQIDPTIGLMVSTANDITGPWSKPHLMKRTSDISDTFCDDPAVYWDEEGHQAYLGLNAGYVDKERNTQIKLFKMSWDGCELLDDGKIIYTGKGAEALRIYKIKGQLYLFISKWFDDEKNSEQDNQITKRDRKQIVLRPKTNNIYGPYDEKIVLQRGNGFDRSCSQGALMEAPDGSWWYTHQLIQNCESPYQGRPQMLEPVEWIDGWPIIGEDINGDGIGEPVVEYRKPIEGYPIAHPQTDDDFDNYVLAPQWEWNHNPRDKHWSLSKRKGYLRLSASIPVNTGGFKNACNTISQRIMGTGKGKAIAKIDTCGMVAGQKAGFVRFGGVFNILGIVMDKNGEKHLYYESSINGTELGPIIEKSIVYIKTINEGDKAKYSYSYDNKTFVRFGPEFKLVFGQWTGDRLGFYSYNDIQEDGYIDIDWFKYKYFD